MGARWWADGFAGEVTGVGTSDRLEGLCGLRSRQGAIWPQHKVDMRRTLVAMKLVWKWKLEP